MRGSLGKYCLELLIATIALMSSILRAATLFGPGEAAKCNVYCALVCFRMLGG